VLLTPFLGGTSHACVYARTRASCILPLAWLIVARACGATFHACVGHGRWSTERNALARD